LRAAARGHAPGASGEQAARGEQAEWAEREGTRRALHHPESRLRLAWFKSTTLTHSCTAAGAASYDRIVATGCQQAGKPMMEARRIVYASDGLPIHYFILRHHPDRYKFLDMLPTNGAAIFEARQD
jgi:hypothetical protein